MAERLYKTEDGKVVKQGDPRARYLHKPGPIKPAKQVAFGGKKSKTYADKGRKGKKSKKDDKAPKGGDE